jgi:hypothetical protein
MKLELCFRLGHEHVENVLTIPAFVQVPALPRVEPDDSTLQIEKAAVSDVIRPGSFRLECGRRMRLRAFFHQNALKGRECCHQGKASPGDETHIKNLGGLIGLKGENL